MYTDEKLKVGKCLLFLLTVVTLLSTPSLLSAYEKVFLHVDRPFYVAGDSVFFRVDVLSLDEDPASRFIYVELLSDGPVSLPSGNAGSARGGRGNESFDDAPYQNHPSAPGGQMCSRVKVKQNDDGFFVGALPVPEDIRSGTYTVRAYTLAQSGMPPEQMCHTRILVSGKGTFSAPPGRYLPACETIEASALMLGHDIIICLRDTSGNPVRAELSVSVMKDDPARYDIPGAAYADAVSADLEYEEWEREYAQNLAMKVLLPRRGLPEGYTVSVLSQETGYYASYQVPGNISDIVIPELYFSDGTSFTVSVSGNGSDGRTGGRHPSLEWKGDRFAEPYDYASAYAVMYAEMKDAILPAGPFANDTILIKPSVDTLSAAVVSADRKPGFYWPKQYVSPYSSVFEVHQVRLREQLAPYDNTDLLDYIVGTFPGFRISIGNAGRSLVTTRGGSIRSRSQRGRTASAASMNAGYASVDLYIDGMKMNDWKEANNLTVDKVQNLYVLRGNEAALYKASAVVLLEMGYRYDSESHSRADSGKPKNTVKVTPLGYQKQPACTFASGASASSNRIYWNPQTFTDDRGLAVLRNVFSAVAYLGQPADRNQEIADQGESVCYLSIAGFTADGRRISLRLRATNRPDRSVTDRSVIDLTDQTAADKIVWK